MKRAVGRAYRRLKGGHPRRPPSRTGRLVEIGCDLLLGAAALAMLAGISVLVWASLSGPDPAQLAGGVALIAGGGLLLLLWEKIAWEPLVRELSDHLAELT